MERQTRRRRRPARSCLGCRGRKIKCDRNNPCGHCVSAGIQCIFRVYRDDPVVEDVPQQRGSPQVPVLNTPAPTNLHPPHSHHISTNEPLTGDSSRSPRSGTILTPAPPGTRGPALVGAGPPPTQSPGHNDNHGAASNNDTQASDQVQDPELDPGDSWQQIRRRGSPSANCVRGWAKSYQGMLMSQPHMRYTLAKPDKEYIVRSGHWGVMAPEFTTVMALYTEAIGHHERAFSRDADTKATVIEVSHLLEKCKSMAKSMKAGRPSRCVSGPLFGLEPPPREIADKMTALYFRSFESTHRILHEPTFWAAYETYWNEPQCATIGTRLMILLVVAIGSGLAAIDTTLRNMAHNWVYMAQTWLSGPLEKDRLNIMGLQVHCLTILARQVLSIGADLVWISVGQLIQSGMQLGLHRDPKRIPSMPAMQSELRRRLWATILDLAVQSSLDAAMPPRISLDEFDTEAPSNVDDYEMDELSLTVDPHPRTTYTATSMQLTLLDSLPTRLRIVQLLNSLHSELSYPEALVLSSGITDACRAHTGFPTPGQVPGVTTFRRNLLDYLVRRFMLPLHSIFVVEARTNPLFHYSIRASLDSAMALTMPEQDETFRHLITVGGGLFREGFRCAVTTICIELLAQVDAQKRDGTLHRDSQYRSLLKGNVKNLLSFSAERIRAGETNVKTHMFLSMVLAQVEAVEEGEACEASIARSAKDSLEFCYDMLRTLVGKPNGPTPDDAGLTQSVEGGQQDYWWESETQLLFGVDFI